MIHAILFDNDGILINTEPLYFQASRQILAEAGVNLTRELYIRHFLQESRGAWHLAKERGASDKDIQRMRKKRNALYAQGLKTEPIFIPGVEDVLKTLAPRFRMAVVTSSRREHFDAIHRRTGLLPYFEFVLTREMYNRSKPDPEPYLTGVEKMGVAADECIIVEDSRRGLDAALAAEIRCVAIPTELTRGSDFTGAWKVLDNLGQLPQVLSRG